MVLRFSEFPGIETSPVLTRQLFQPPHWKNSTIAAHSERSGQKPANRRTKAHGMDQGGNNL
jgi:hypothetical protein